MISWQPGKTIAMVERDVIELALQYTRGNKTKAAALLDIAIRTLDNKLESYKESDLERDRAEQRADEASKLHQSKPVIQTVDTRPGVEPYAQVPEESEVSVRQREKVQSVPSKQVAANGNSRRG